MYLLPFVEEAKELLKKFGILYLKNYGATVFEKIKSELAASKAGDDFRLTYRPVKCLESCQSTGPRGP
jgi:hypothetical protein